MDTVFQERYERLRTEMKEKDWDCVVLWPSSNLFYLTGYSPKRDERLQIAFFPVIGEPVFIVPKLYSGQAGKQCWIKDKREWQDGENVYDLVLTVVKEMGIEDARIAIDDTMGFMQADPILKACPRARFGLASSVLMPLRNIKGTEEIALMEQSAKISDEVMSLAIQACISGKSELEIRDYVELEMKNRGMTGPFSNLIASGPNSANPHHTSDDRIPAKGDVVFLDIGGAFKHYWSDITRTVCFGTPHKKVREAYKQVQEAQKIAREAVRPGTTAEQVHAAAYNYLARQGLEKYFIHRTGHGIGLDGHELLSISSNSKIILEPGMIFSVEPGVYFPGEFGIRIEDCVVVTEKGYKPLNDFQHDLIIL